MRWWICCGALAVLALVTVPAFDSPAAVADIEAPGPVVPGTSTAPDADIVKVPAPVEPSFDPPEAVPVIDFCCARCDARYNLCVANCGSNAACIQNCEARFDTCAAGCQGGC